MSRDRYRFEMNSLEEDSNNDENVDWNGLIVLMIEKMEEMERQVKGKKRKENEVSVIIKESIIKLYKVQKKHKQQREREMVTRKKHQQTDRLQMDAMDHLLSMLHFNQNQQQQQQQQHLNSHGNHLNSNVSHLNHTCTPILTTPSSQLSTNITTPFKCYQSPTLNHHPPIKSTNIKENLIVFHEQENDEDHSNIHQKREKDNNNKHQLEKGLSSANGLSSETDQQSNSNSGGGSANSSITTDHNSNQSFVHQQRMLSNSEEMMDNPNEYHSPSFMIMPPHTPQSISHASQLNLCLSSKSLKSPQSQSHASQLNSLQNIFHTLNDSDKSQFLQMLLSNLSIQ